MIKNWKINKKCNLVECNVVCQEIVLAPIFCYSLILFLHYLDVNRNSSIFQQEFFAVPSPPS